MARFIVLRVEDNARAEELARQLVTDGGVTTYASPADDLPEVLEASVVGLFAIPTKFCECTEPDEGLLASMGGRRITRGEKLGWWIHRGCGRPIKGSWQSPRNLIDSNWSHRDPEFMFQPKLTWIHKQVMPQHVRDAAEVTPPSDDARTTPE